VARMPNLGKGRALSLVLNGSKKPFFPWGAIENGDIDIGVPYSERKHNLGDRRESGGCEMTLKE